MTTEELFRAGDELVRTMAVKPACGQGRVRLVEIERVEVARIGKKGRLKRRVLVQLLD